MKILIQRVKQASVLVEEKITGSIDQGLLIFFGVHKNDTAEKTLWLAKKVVNLRLFRDENDKMNLNVQDVNGNILVVSQFTLYGDCTYSRRPDFAEAAYPEHAKLLYETFLLELAQEMKKPIQTGQFGAAMEVSSINDGPVTFIIEK